MNRAIRAHELSAIYVTGPGHGGPGLVASAYLDGTCSEVYRHIGHDEEGVRRLFRQFSFRGGIPSHVAPETPGSIHEGGELGYSLLRAYGAVLDNPELVALCVVGATPGDGRRAPAPPGPHKSSRRGLTRGARLDLAWPGSVTGDVVRSQLT
jgi:xylulose-5-phosphate/fructose-6-phosphate phosphoketolase